MRTDNTIDLPNYIEKKPCRQLSTMLEVIEKVLEALD